MRRTIILATLATAVAFATGCAGTVGYSGTVTATTPAPALVYAAPGVQVIADYEEPIFYSDNYYWRYYDGGWYRSSWYTGGWAYASPPRAVLSINRPYSYRHYRPHGYVANRGYVRDRGYQRDYRSRPTVIQRTEVRPQRTQVRSVRGDSRARGDARVRVHRR